MNKLLLLLSACAPVWLSAAGANGLSAVKPAKQPGGQPGITYTTVTHTAAQGPGLYKPMPFLQKNAAPVAANLQVKRDPLTGMPILIDNIHSPGTVTTENAASVAINVLSSLNSLTGIKDANSEFVVMTTEADDLGFVHVKLQQTFKGLPVYGSQAWLHFNPNGTVCFNGRTQLTPGLQSVLPVLNTSSANGIVANDVRSKTIFTEFTPQDEVNFKMKQYVNELVLLPTKNSFGHFNLAWHVTVRPNVVYRYEYFVDAITGEILNSYDNTCAVGPATANMPDLKGISRSIGTFNANGTYYLVDASKSMFTGSTSSLPGAGKGTIITLDLQNTNLQNPSYVDITSAGNNSWSAKSVSAHYNAETSWDYYKINHNRNSIDGNGGDVVSFINVADDNGGGLDNAFWNGQYMFYGNGNVAFTPLAKGLDVGGHEMTHGVVQATANLEYQNESGALNESFADVFGVLIDPSNWILGEDVVNLAYFPSGALRNMQDPHNGGNSLADNGWQPAHVNEKYTGTQDNGGVHINSGIPNKAFYLLANSIGRNAAGAIYYRALANYLTKSSQFIDARLAVVKAAEDLHGTNSTESNAAKSAFDAVGITDGNGTNTTPTLPTNPGLAKLILLNLDPQDNNSIYLTDNSFQNFTPISTTLCTHKPSVTDDGSYALFVGNDHNIYSIMLNSPYTQNQLTTDNYWDNVAISKDGNRIAAVSQMQDTSIWVYDFGLQSWGRYYLYNPTTGAGVNAGGVLYADAIEWDYSGQYVMYDSYNRIGGNGGSYLDYWDIGIIRTWNPGSNNFGDGEIFKIYNNLDEGVNLGNPTFSKNSPYIIAFDYFNTSTNEYAVLGANLETNTTGTIWNNNEVGFPTYSPTDGKIAFNNINTNNQAILAVVDVDNTKINGVASTALAAVLLGGYAQWYGTGDRALAVDEVADTHVTIYPNPTNNQLHILLPENFGGCTLEVYNLLGEKMLNRTVATTEGKTITIDAATLQSGTYFVRLNNGRQTIAERFIKW